MTGPPAAGEDFVRLSTYRCTACGYVLAVTSTTKLPFCPRCQHGYWDIVHGSYSQSERTPDPE